MGRPLTEVLRPELATWTDLHAQMRFRPSGQFGSSRSHTVALVVRGASQALICNIRAQFLHSMDSRVRERAILDSVAVCRWLTRPCYRPSECAAYHDG